MKLKRTSHSHTAKTPLVRQIQKAFKLALHADKNNIPPSEIKEMQHEAYSSSRRNFIEQSAKSLIALSAGSFLLESCKKSIEIVDKNGKNYPKIAIVGGGMAGLNCAFTLKNNNVDSTIYEANTRAGGRIFTAKDIMGNGLTTELGGEFIDSGHWDMRNLASQFGLSLIDLESPANAGLIKNAYYFNNQYYTEQDVINAFIPIASKMQADIDMLPDEITFENPGNAVLFDNISLDEYITNLNCDPWLKNLLEVAFVTEYGLDTGRQSCINMLYLISTDTSGGKFEVFGDSDERYKIEGGNQSLTDALVQNLTNKIVYEYKLVSISKNFIGKYILTFSDQNNTLVDVLADFVVLALPFTLLREVNFDFKLPTWKMNAINSLGYGTNAKLFVGFNNRPWRNIGYRGYAFTDESFQLGWDNSELQTPSSGGYTFFTGGNVGVNLGIGTPQSQAALHLPGFEKVFPGSLANQNGKIERMHWPTAPFVKASYACYKPGQFTTIAGAERKPVDGLFFAGEHCSLSFQGYMNGAAETGRVAGEKVLKAI